MRTLRPLFLALLALAAARAAHGAAGQDSGAGTSPTVPPARPAAPLPGSRVLRTFDFEETKLGNFESIPMYWSKVVGRGFPAYSTGAFDHAVSRSSNTSFLLQTQGGSVAYRFAPPPEKRIAIQPNSDYYLLAFVRTSALQHARADLVAWFADENGELIASTETHSQPYTPADAPRADQDAWQVLSLYMPGPAANTSGPLARARSLVLQAGLMQPQQLGASDSGLGRFAIYKQDIQGSAWFDDITIFQLPRVGISASRKPGAPSGPVGIYGPQESIALDVQLSDLARSAGGLRARVRITDADGLVYGTEEWRAAAAENPDAEKAPAWSHQYTHAPLPPGMYTATLDVLDPASTGEGALVAHRQTRFLCLPQVVPSASAAREFGIGALSYSEPDSWPDLPALLKQTGSGLVQLPAWRKNMAEDDLVKRDPAFDALLATLQRQNVHTIAALAALPDVVAAHIGPVAAEDRNSLLALVPADPKSWRQYLSLPVTRYANRVDYWQLSSQQMALSGPLTGETIGSTTTVMERGVKLYERTYAEMGGLMPREELIIPWNALVEFDPARYPHAMLDLRLPAVIKPAQLPAYIDNFRTSPGTAATRPASAPAPANRPLIAHVDGLGARDVSRADRLADFAQRLVYVRAAAPEAILFDVQQQDPDELLLVYAAMARALGGTTYAGELALPGGPGERIKAFLFRKPGGPGATAAATLVLWSQVESATPLPLDLPLGAAPQLADLLGSRKPLTPDPTTRLSRVTVGTSPVVLENVEPDILQLMASYSLARSALPAGEGSMRTEVLLRNPYNEAITGTLRFLPPKGWSVDPPSLPVSILPGGSFRQTITIQYPFAENAGEKQLPARLDLDPGNPAKLNRLALSCPVSIGSDQIDMEGFASYGSAGELILQQVITNTSTAPLDGQAYAAVAGFPRQQRYIVALQPGQTVIKRYAFTPADAGAMPAEAGSRMATIGVRQTDGRTLLTRAVPLE